MNEENRLPESILGSVVTWILAAISWIFSHAGAITLILAIVASLYSIQASRETIKLRRKQQEKLNSPEPED